MDMASFLSDSEVQSDPELSTLMAEILSLESERKGYLESLTPRISRWVDDISETATSFVRNKLDSKEPFGILEDVEDLGHRMLSMSQFLRRSSSMISLYKADELVSTVSKLKEISDDLYKSTEKEKRKKEKKKMRKKAHKENKKQLKEEEEEEEEEEEAAEEKRKKEKKVKDKMRKKEKNRKKKQNVEERGEGTSKEITQKMGMKKGEEEVKGTSRKITEKMEMKNEDEEEKKMSKEPEVRKNMLPHQFLLLSANVLAKPFCYKNELAVMITEENEQEHERLKEAEREAERERQRQMERIAKMRQRRPKKDEPKKDEPLLLEEKHEQETKSPTERLKERMDFELQLFNDRRRDWEWSSGSKAGRWGDFENLTTLSPMQFTHCMPGIIPPRAAVTGSTLQIYSYKIVELKKLKWPLYVYGLVAARDTVDRNRNLLFSRPKLEYQELTENDCSLCLTGPSRAILAVDPVDFEVELRLHDGGDEHKDRELICVSNRYSGEQPSLTFSSPLCTVELRLERLPTTVQATILSVRVVGGGSPFKSGGQVACLSSTSDATAVTCKQVVLLDSVEGIPKEDEPDFGGYLPLSRNVVSVELEGGLTVLVKAYGGSGSTSGSVYFPSQYCNISEDKCVVCDSEVKIVVAWSWLVGDKMDMLIEGYTTQA